ncbi:phosphate ABC transporter permease PstA [Tannockella kyphosi]|uniref:phosphate ABC transporter permease PstA n=1 Tax=Tannockella kyphosi TaxID=2899121 RepID=UPI00201296F8|nr:phosphate ABC transporter permease PstA [Tannockella kyphosi]
MTSKSIFDGKKRRIDTITFGLIQGSSLLAVGILALILGYIVYQGVPVFDWKYLIQVPSTLYKIDGLLPSIINTLYIIFVTLVIACPIGIASAIYLQEYAQNKKFVEVVSFTTEILSGIPSIIFGLFGMLFFGNVFGLNYSVLTGSFTLAIMILPTIIRSTQVALTYVPKSYREAALGIGATKWYMIRTVLLPSAMPGILTGLILAMGRIVAESAALIYTAGSGKVLPTGIFSHLFSSAATLTVDLYLQLEKANFDLCNVIALVLIVIVLCLNLLAKWITKKFDVNRID